MVILKWSYLVLLDSYPIEKNFQFRINIYEFYKVNHFGFWAIGSVELVFGLVKLCVEYDNNFMHETPVMIVCVCVFFFLLLKKKKYLSKLAGYIFPFGTAIQALKHFNKIFTWLGTLTSSHCQIRRTRRKV